VWRTRPSVQAVVQARTPVRLARLGVQNVLVIRTHRKAPVNVHGVTSAPSTQVSHLAAV